MEKEIDVIVEEYKVDQIKCKKYSIITYFKKVNSEYEILKIGFYNCTEEINFLLYALDNIADDNCLKEKRLQIALIDSIPVALINPKTNDICIIKYPVSEDKTSFIYNGNIFNLQNKYNKDIEFFEEKIKDEISKLTKEEEMKLKLEMENIL